MNIMRVSEFPPWWVRNQLTRIYNRYRDSINQVVSALRFRTWIDSYSKARSKLIYRCNAFRNTANVEEIWKSVVTYQATKLYKRYDVVYLWGLNEFNNLDKMNKIDFGRDLFPNIIWKFKAIEKSAELNKYNKRNRQKNDKSTDSWEHIYCSVANKLGKHDDITWSFIDCLWGIWSRANRDKIKYHFYYVDWGSCAHQNMKKLRCITINYNKLQTL